MTKKTDRIKRRILNALENNRARVLNIEIMRSEYMENRWNIRMGDIIGSIEHSNAEIKQILKEIEDEMRSLK